MQRLLILVFGFWFISQALAGSREVRRTEIFIPSITERPKIDGHLDDPAWQHSLLLNTFYQFAPQNGVTPSESTWVYLMYDPHYIYVAFRCFDSEPGKIRASLTPRNQWVNDDNAFIYLDTYDNQRDNFLFQINPLGVQRNSFDTIWYSSGRIDSLGWTGEMAIPFKSLRFPNQPEQQWGVVFGRNIYRKGEILNTVYCDYDDDFHQLFHRARGIADISAGHNLEFLPYSAARYSHGTENIQKEAAFGLDTKVSLASNLVWDSSLSPDFSQVESDPFFVNFTPYEYQLAENRLFFSEGADRFSLPWSLFYSRRIENPKIMSKITGKSGPWSLGLLGAWDTPAAGEEKFVEALRIQKDVFRTSKIGLMLSGFESQRGDYNRNFSIDGQFNQGMYHHLTLQLATTFNANTRNRDNNLFYLKHAINRYVGLNYYLSYLDIGPDYNPRTGIIGQKGFRNPSFMLGYQWRLPEFGLESIHVSANAGYSEAYSGLTIGKSTGLAFSLGFIQKFSASVNVSASQDRAEILNGGELVWNPQIFPASSTSLNFSTNTGAKIDGNFNCAIGHSALYVDNFARQEPGRNQSYTVGLTLRLKPNLVLQTSQNYYQQKLNETQSILYENYLFQNSLHYQITRNIFSKVIQYFNTRQNSQQVDLLLGYEFYAGSTFYLAYKEFREYEAFAFDRGNYMFFGKMSYLFRI